MSDSEVVHGAEAGQTELGWRMEQDFLGDVQVPADVLYGIGTARALQNSGVGGDLLTQHPALVAAMADVKAAAALANESLGRLPDDVASALVQAADEMAAGDLDSHVPIELVQGGGGTAANVNINEVLANRASQLLGSRVGPGAVVDAYGHANMSQSTNDVFPTAVSVAVYRQTQGTLRALETVSLELLNLAKAHEGIEHLGRSCLQDAVPILISDLHRTHEVGVARARNDLSEAAHGLLSVPLGGTIVGNGLGAPEGYAEVVCEKLRERTRLPLCSSHGRAADGIASLEPLAATADAVARGGRVLARIASDLRLLASGPVGGMGEVILPPVQAGSSIMPGKVNPVLPELVMQVSYELAGAAHTVSLAAGSTDLEVTPMGPVAAAHVLRGLSQLESVATLFAERCLRGLRWDPNRVERNLAGSFADAVHASLRIGYSAAARDRYQQMSRSRVGSVDGGSIPWPSDAGVDSLNGWPNSSSS